ncbi:HutD family protein [Tissierella praeacuta]|uniref:HutD family protein n=1 Tax=Tissierella praeacuta TaxID=43131 RepID=UPI001C10EEBE|nr:HutD family protein [Tissierella praeacuta]MBU5257049.1 HutD family protein [Tissierella praeacuta]
MEVVKKLIKQNDYITTEWSGGKTTQLFIYPEDSNYDARNFKFRLSSATVELGESEFTKLEGIHRFITPLNGELKLTHNHKDYINLKPFEIYEFDGGINTTSYGIVKDFNLMLGNGVKGELESIYIDREYSLIKENQSNFNEIFYFIYAYNNIVYISFNKEINIIKPFEIFLIKLNGNLDLNLNINSQNPSDILLARIYI